MKRLLVTGGAGFIGSHVIDKALSNGWKVRSFDLQPIADFIHPNFDSIVGDISNYQDLLESMTHCDAVLHLAAIVSVPESIKRPKETHHVNVIGTQNVIEACEEANISRLIIASSAAVYGRENKMPLLEEHAGSCLSPYAQSKWANETQIFDARRRGLDALALRFFNVYGPNQSISGPYAAVIANFIQQICAGDRPTIFGDGNHTRDFIHVRDLVEAILRFFSLPTESITHHVYNLSTGTSHSISSLVESINHSLRILNPSYVNVQPKYEAAREGDVLHSEGSIVRLIKCLDWSPSIPFDDGIHELVKLKLEKVD